MTNADDADDERHAADLAPLLMRVVNALGLSPIQDKLTVLLALWMMLAAQARNDQLPFPGGFVEERDRQANQLQRMLDMVRAATPDLEGERLFLEGMTTGDLDAWRDHVVRQLREAAEKQDDDDRTD